MSLYYEQPGVALYHGDCRETLRTLPKVDAIICDPPYGLSFMGKDWDHQVPGVTFWEILRNTLKPGGHLLAFGGTRTYHRLTCAIEDAGFEIRDCLMWLFGSGFPKSLNVSKAIDKAGGTSPREQAALLKKKRESRGISREDLANQIGCTASSVRDWEEGRSRAVGKPLEFITPSADYREKLASLLGYSADERKLTKACQDRRGDGSIMGLGHSGQLSTGGNTPASLCWEGWGTALKPAWEPIILARKPLEGTVAANVLKYGTGALNIDACRVEGRERTDYGLANAKRTKVNTFSDPTADADFDASKGRWPANVILDEEAGRLLDNQTGESRSRVGVPRKSSRPGEGYGMTHTGAEYNDSGGASRFFYCPRASRKERGVDNNHPTVKPLALMRYLCRLVTPAGGTVLDPFMGSGSTLVAARQEGFRVVGADTEESYCSITKARLQEHED